MTETIDEQQDMRFLNAALRLARKHHGLTGTNPSVACVVVNDLGFGAVIVGSGITAIGGRPHAEPPAISEAGKHVKGATAYVTLEPCAHHGKTPPCAQTLIDAGVARVVTAIADPDDRVDGKGHEMMRKAGIEIDEIGQGALAERVMAGYLSSRSQKRPFVSLKLAMTQEGIIGLQNKGNLKISGPISNRQTHLSRARHDAILVGIGTALADDPMLTCRLPGLEDRSPTRIVLDSKNRLPEDSRLISSAATTRTIVAGSAEHADNSWLNMLRLNSVHFITCEISEGYIALPELLDDLLAQGILSIMVEGGAQLAQSFLDEELVDEIIIHVGGEPEELSNVSDAVLSPISLDNIPAPFEMCQKLTFGVDTSLRLTKTGK